MDQFFNALTITPYTLKLEAPFFIKKGFHLEWKNKEGKKLLSDVSPLLGYSKESLSLVFDQLKLIQKEKIIPDENLYPSVHFALNHPIEDFSKIKKQRYQALIQKNSWEKDAKKIALFKTLKIKTKDFSDHELMNLILELSSTHVLRLDAQRAPLSPLLRDFLLSHENLYDYIEEPDLQDKKAHDLKIALDETLYLEKKIPNLPHIAAFIYKPTLCGGLNRMGGLFNKAFEDKIPIILSSCYESSLGITMLMQMQQGLNPDQDCGLDTSAIDEEKPYLKKLPPFLEVL
jgi:O-succinylbenzoate synthase